MGRIWYLRKVRAMGRLQLYRRRGGCEGGTRVDIHLSRGSGLGQQIARPTRKFIYPTKLPTTASILRTHTHTNSRTPTQPLSCWFRVLPKWIFLHIQDPTVRLPPPFTEKHPDLLAEYGWWCLLDSHPPPTAPRWIWTGAQISQERRSKIPFCLLAAWTISYVYDDSKNIELCSLLRHVFAKNSQVAV